MTEADARDTLEEAEFDVAVEGRPHKRVEEGEVFRQDPKADTQAETGDTVTIFVSEGIRQVTVPDLIGMTLEEAEAALKEAKLKLGEVTSDPLAEGEAGTIVRQFPTADRETDSGSAVDVVIVGPTTVPNVVGMSQDEAEATLSEAGYGVAVNTEPNDEFEEGIVFAQDPEEGTELEEGQTVTIVVSEGSAAEPMPDVTGMDADEAEALLEEDYGLVVSQDEGACASPPGTVCDQDPSPGTEVSPGDSATLFVQPGDAFLPPGGAFAWLVAFLA